MTKEKEYDYSQMLYEAMRGRTYKRKKENIIYISNKFDDDEYFALYAVNEDYNKAVEMLRKESNRKKFRENGE